MTKYEMTLRWLYEQLPMYQRIGPPAMKWSLDNIQKLVADLGNPHEAYPVIHVAGTNGKGSVTHMIASILQESGLKVGLHTSPHYKDFRERIKINGHLIPKKDVIHLVERIRNSVTQINPSFFEMTVAMTFAYFARQKVDVAVIETGLGGRLDSTNIVSPVLSVITGIHLDHQSFLGDTVEEIAKEKAGIIKNQIPVVVGKVTDSVRNVFLQSANQKQSEITFVQDHWQLEFIELLPEYSHYKVKKDGIIWNDNLMVQVGGKYQKNNIKTVLGAIEALQPILTVKRSEIYRGFSNLIKNTYYIGRWQWLKGYPTRIICDSAHNAQGYEAVFAQINTLNFKKLHIVWGMVREKELSELLKYLPNTAQYYFCAAKVPRSIPASELMEKANNFNLEGKVYTSVKRAKAAAIATADADDLILIGGSTFVVAEVL